MIIFYTILMITLIFYFLRKLRSIYPSAITLMCTFVLAASAQAQNERILIMGDSWAAWLWNSGAYQISMTNKGLSPSLVRGEKTAQIASLTSDWITPEYLAYIEEEIIAAPTLDIFHMWMGGNDTFFCFDPCDEDQLYDEIAANIQTVVDFILSLKPNAKIFWTTYDYLPLMTSADSLPLTQRMVEQANQTGSFKVLNINGLTQHTYGYEPFFSSGEKPLPGQHPDYIPLLGGDPDFDTDPNYMSDEFHLNYDGYVNAFEFGIEQYYAAILADDELNVPFIPAPINLFLALIIIHCVRSIRSNHYA